MGAGMVDREGRVRIVISNVDRRSVTQPRYRPGQPASSPRRGSNHLLGAPSAPTGPGSSAGPPPEPRLQTARKASTRGAQTRGRPWRRREHRHLYPQAIGPRAARSAAPPASLDRLGTGPASARKNANARGGAAALGPQGRGPDQRERGRTEGEAQRRIPEGRDGVEVERRMGPGRDSRPPHASGQVPTRPLR